MATVGDVVWVNLGGAWLMVDRKIIELAAGQHDMIITMMKACVVVVVVVVVAAIILWL